MIPVMYGVITIHIKETLVDVVQIVTTMNTMEKRYMAYVMGVKLMYMR